MKSEREVLKEKVVGFLKAANNLGGVLNDSHLFSWEVNDRSVRVYGLTDTLLSLQLLFLHRILNVNLYHEHDEKGRYLEFYICV